MQKLRRVLTLLVVLALGFGTPLAAFAAPAPVKPGSVAAESPAAMADVQGDDCTSCPAQPDVMPVCVPTCINPPALAQAAVRASLGRTSYDLPVEQAFSGADSRPDPYPPKQIILA